VYVRGFVRITHGGPVGTAQLSERGDFLVIGLDVRLTKVGTNML
jgi:hypothetical protein